MYTPNNIYVYLQAFSGAVAGLTGQSRALSAVHGYFDDPVAIAGAWAEEVDHLWGVSTDPDQFQYEEILDFSNDFFLANDPQAQTIATLPATYFKTASALLSLLADAEDYLATQGITPPAITDLPPGFGPTLTVVGGEFVAHINSATGSDNSSADGSNTRPFRSPNYTALRLAYLTESSTPQLARLFRVGASTLHYYLDTPLGDDLVNSIGYLYEVVCPLGGKVLIDGSPSQTIVQSGHFTAIAQTSNYGLSPGHAEVVTLDAPAAAGNLLVNTTSGCAGWIQRAGAGCQVAGADNVELSSPDSGTLLAVTATPETAPAWPGVPAAITPGATDAYEIVQLASFAWGGSFTFRVGGSLAGSTSAAQLTIYRCGFVDSGAFRCSGFGANVSIVESSHGGTTGATLYDQSVSGFNTAVFIAGLDGRGLDHYFIGGWAATKIADQSGNFIVDGGTTMDNATFSSTGSDGAGCGSVLFRAGALTALQNLGGNATWGPAVSQYTGKIGFISNPVFHVQTLANTEVGFGAFVYAQIFGALSTTFYIGNWPYVTSVFSTFDTVNDPYGGAIFGTDPSQNGITYNATTVQAIDATGQVLNGALTANAAATVTTFVAAGHGIEVHVSTEIDAGAGGATGELQLWVDGAASSDAIVGFGPFGALAYKLPISRPFRFDAANIGVGSHTFTVASLVSAGAASLPANATVTFARVAGVS